MKYIKAFTVMACLCITSVASGETAEEQAKRLQGELNKANEKNKQLTREKIQLKTDAYTLSKEVKALDSERKILKNKNTLLTERLNEVQQSSFCDRQNTKQVLICIDATGKNPTIYKTYPSNLIISPNQTVNISIKYGTQYKPTIKSITSSSTGLFVPGVSQPARSKTAKSATAANNPPAPKTIEVQTLKTGPFLPGKNTIKFEFVHENDATENNELSVDINVEKTYSSAIRVGVGLLFGDVVDATFVNRKVNNSQQDEIVNTESSDMDLELVLGYAFFLDDNGRGYVNSCYPWCLAPYAGVGVLSSNRTELKWFNALYLGLEWSPIPESSIALAGVVRRVDRLYQGKVGDPVKDAPVTISTYNLGLALVVNFSPEFIQFAKDYGTTTPSNQ